MSKSVMVLDGAGRSFTFPSIAKAARELRMDYSVVKTRVEDGNWIFRAGQVPVRIRRIQPSSTAFGK